MMKYKLNSFYNEDCLPAMKEFPDKYFDLAIIDPPYGIGEINQAAGRKIHKKMTWNNCIPQMEYFDELKRVSRHKIVWGVNYYTKFIQDVGRIIHDKTEIGTNGHRFKELSDADIASHSFGVNIKMFKFTWMGNFQGKQVNWNNNGLNGRIHPTQKPVELYRWCLHKYAQPGWKIL